MGLKQPSIEIRQHPSSGLFRLYDAGNNLWIVRRDGSYPYADGGTNSAATSGGDQWIGETTAQDRLQTQACNLLSLDVLNLICNRLKDNGLPVQLKTLVGASGAQYKGIWYNRQFLADSKGRPYAAQATTPDWAVNQPRPDTTVKDEEGNEITEELPQGNQTNIDLSGMTITLPDGKILVADQIIYDESTKTYSIDSHDTYNITNNYYYTWNYYINYTSITYIGQSEEYNKYYEVYYELPDGRDSADLTAEELEQLNLDVDVIPYGRSADDVSLRSLYHFDGDTKDSSYWNYCTDFTWNKGASLTYLESGSFDGCLYLDETEHDFTLRLPSDIGGGDFDFRFRYYQSATAAPQTDSYIKLGNAPVLWFNGAAISYGAKATDTTQLSVMPAGSWNEIGLVRKGGTLYYYLNGVCVGNVPDTTAYPASITFHFGAEQQTYKQLDELRFVNQALADAPSNYTPTSVPYDTNLSLVLPDSQVPVADEYWSVTSSGENLLSGDFTTGRLPDGFVVSSNTGSGGRVAPNLGVYSGGNGASAEAFSSFMRLTRKAEGSTSTPRLVGLHSLIYSSVNSVSLPKGVYTFSVALADGQVYSHVFDSTVPPSDIRADVSTSFPGGKIGIDYVSNDGDHYWYAYVAPSGAGRSLDILYVELAEGDTTDLSAEWVTSITGMDPDQMKTPTLAVRTDIPITSHQIGGPRPSLPEKGMVWALVESQFIKSLQIYNGQAWEAVGGRIWTGERWIPYSSYNVITLQDMYDVVDASGDNFEYIYTEQGFWAWWQKSWNAFTDRLFKGLGIDASGSGPGLGGGSGSGSAGTQSFWSKLKDKLTDGLASLIETLFDLVELVLKELLGLVTDTLSFFFDFLMDGLVTGVRNLFDAFKGNSFTDFFQQEVMDEEGNVTTTTGLPGDVAAAMSFISGTFMCLPADIRNILLFGLGISVLFALFRLVKS